MSAAENKTRVVAMFESMAKGDGNALVALLADDVRWTVTGTTPLSKVFASKQAVVEGLLGPLQAGLRGPFTVRATRVIADDDIVVAEFRGEGNVTRQGRPYNNAYCLVARMRDGQIVEATEYLDTALVMATFAPP